MSDYFSFKWISSLCQYGKPFYCALAKPDCPSGYEEINAFSDSCFKVIIDTGVTIRDENGVSKIVHSEAKVYISNIYKWMFVNIILEF